MLFKTGDRIQLRYRPDEFFYGKAGITITDSIALDENNTILYGEVVSSQLCGTYHTAIVIRFDACPEEELECCVDFLEYYDGKKELQEENSRDWFVRIMS